MNDENTLFTTPIEMVSSSEDLKKPHSDRIRPFIKQIYETRKRQNKDLVIGITGPKGSGKSTFALSIAADNDPAFTCDTICTDIQDFQSIFMKSKERVIIVDDPRGLKQWNSRLTEFMKQYLQTTRPLLNMVIFTMPYSKDVCLEIYKYVDLVIRFVKRDPSLHNISARIFWVDAEAVEGFVFGGASNKHKELSFTKPVHLNDFGYFGIRMDGGCAMMGGNPFFAGMEILKGCPHIPVCEVIIPPYNRRDLRFRDLMLEYEKVVRPIITSKAGEYDISEGKPKSTLIKGFDVRRVSLDIFEDASLLSKVGKMVKNRFAVSKDGLSLVLRELGYDASSDEVRQCKWLLELAYENNNKKIL